MEMIGSIIEVRRAAHKEVGATKITNLPRMLLSDHVGGQHGLGPF